MSVASVGLTALDTQIFISQISNQYIVAVADITVNTPDNNAIIFYQTVNQKTLVGSQGEALFSLTGTFTATTPPQSLELVVGTTTLTVPLSSTTDVLIFNWSVSFISNYTNGQYIVVTPIDQQGGACVIQAYTSVLYFY